MREEVISSGGTMDPTPAASSAGASSPAVPVSISSIARSSCAHDSKTPSLSCYGSQLPLNSMSNSAGDSALGSMRPCKPWERGDLLRRLATFKPLNWVGKPKVATSLACARRGWINTGIDKIACESCGVCLSFSPSSSWSATEGGSAGKMFARQLDVGHRASCPWKGNSCPEGLVQFPPTPPSALIGGFKDRCDGLLQFHVLPLVSPSTIGHMQLSRAPSVDRFLSMPSNFISNNGDFRPGATPEPECSKDSKFSLYFRAQKIISLCGWEPRWQLSVHDCEEHSTQSAQNGACHSPSEALVLRHPQDPGPSKNAPSSHAKKSTGRKKLVEARNDSRMPLLDCSLCGATVRVSDFSTVVRPTFFAPNSSHFPEANKKSGLGRGASAASGVSGWIADDAAREHNEDRDEVGTTLREVDLNLTMAGGFSFSHADQTLREETVLAGDMGRDLMIGQPSGSEVGGRAASIESNCLISRKRVLEAGCSSDYKLHLIHPTDSVEGIVIDRDGDEVTDGKQFLPGPSKRARNLEFFSGHYLPYHRDSSHAAASHSAGVEIYGDGFRFSSARDSTRASSVIAMDTACRTADDDSMESVENYVGDIDDAHFPFSTAYGNLDANETSELNNISNQAQQSMYFRHPAGIVAGEVGAGSTNEGEDFNVETVTAQARDGVSFGISGGSVGMCASHEAEIHGVDVSARRADSAGGCVGPRNEDLENQGQTGESGPGPGLMDEIIPDEINQEELQDDIHEMLSGSTGRADSGSKVDGSAKTESVESGAKANKSYKLEISKNAPPSLSCNTNLNSSSYGATKRGIMKASKSISMNNFMFAEIDHAGANEAGPPKVGSNYDGPVEFDPIIHHNPLCPWVNGNVAAAGCGHGNNADAEANCGWQLTLDALDVLQSLGSVPVHAVQSESAASLHKDDHRTCQNVMHLKAMGSIE